MLRNVDYEERKTVDAPSTELNQKIQKRDRWWLSVRVFNDSVWTFNVTYVIWNYMGSLQQN
jgi:hypothetical protein